MAKKHEPSAVAEDRLIQYARSVISKSAWMLGECASDWHRMYARGRTDADFAALLDVKEDYIYERRRVWETFSDVRDEYPLLTWSHFKVAIAWQDSAECLGWAQENSATVAEMKAWRRLQHGEDLTESPADDPFGESTGNDKVPVRTGTSAATNQTADRIVRPTVQKTQAAIAPAATPQPAAAPGRRDDNEDDDITIDRPPGAEPVQMDPDSTVGRCSIALERINRLLAARDGEVLDDCSDKVRNRFKAAASDFLAAIESVLGVAW